MLAVSARDEGPRMPVLSRIVLQPGVTAVRPSRLTASQAAALVELRTDEAGLPDDRIAVLVRRAEGLPLLVEELAVALRDAPAGSAPAPQHANQHQVDESEGHAD